MLLVKGTWSKDYCVFHSVNYFNLSLLLIQETFLQFYSASVHILISPPYIQRTPLEKCLLTGALALFCVVSAAAAK